MTLRRLSIFADSYQVHLFCLRSLPPLCTFRSSSDSSSLLVLPHTHLNIFLPDAHICGTWGCHWVNSLHLVNKELSRWVDPMTKPRGGIESLFDKIRGGLRQWPFQPPGRRLDIIICSGVSQIHFSASLGLVLCKKKRISWFHKLKSSLMRKTDCC